MQIVVTPTVSDELVALSQLCQEAKAQWGYDASFMKACAEELTMTQETLKEGPCVTAYADRAMVGVAQIGADGRVATLHLLYVAPSFWGYGVGKRLFEWAIDTSTAQGASRLLIVSDPHAAPFYQHMGARLIGTMPSGSIAGRVLPHLAVDLKAPKL